MECKITFRNLDHTEALDSTIKEKSKKISKLLGEDSVVHWVCWTEKDGHHAEIKVSQKQNHLIAKACSESLYKTIDMTIEKLINQIKHIH